MADRYKSIFITVIFSLSLISCATQEMVVEKSLESLHKKYNENFKVVSVNMNRDEGNWGSADLVVTPENDTSLAFSVIYDYSTDILTWENYKGALWNREIGREAESIICPEKCNIKVKAQITSKGSITLNSMDLPYKKNYIEAVPLIDRPAVSFKIDILSHKNCSDSIRPLDSLISAAENFRNRGFGKVMFSVNLFCGDKQDKAYEVLNFKLTRELPLPDQNSIKKLIIKNGGSVVDAKISEIYKDARKQHESGDEKGALPLYMTVVKLNDNPYRYDAYAPAESGYVIESAFYAAEIERKKGNRAGSRKLYSLVADRVRYIEVKGDFYEMEKEALKYLDMK